MITLYNDKLTVITETEGEFKHAQKYIRADLLPWVAAKSCVMESIEAVVVGQHDVSVVVQK